MKPPRVGVIFCAAVEPAIRSRELATAVSKASGGAPQASLGLGAGALTPALEAAQAWLSPAAAADLVLLVAEDQLGIGAALLAREDRVRAGTVFARVEYSAGMTALAELRPGDAGLLETDMWPPRRRSSPPVRCQSRTPRARSEVCPPYGAWPRRWLP